jgi:3-phenylpropionate/cinnamic acid dioxygenase small subunit
VKLAVAPPAVNVNVPVRWEAAGFAAALTETLAPEAPEVGDADSHDWLEDTDQEAAFVVGTTVAEPPAAGADQVDADSVKVADAGACVTVKLAVAPPAVNVNVPCRWEAVGLAAALTETLAPDAPDVGDADNHDWLDDTDQEAAFVVGTTVVEPAAARACQLVGESDSVAAAGSWVTVKVAGNDPAVNTTWADRDAATVFAAAVTVTDWPVWPVWRLNDNQDAAVDTDQVPRFVVTTTDRCPPAAAACHDDGDTDNTAPS